MTELETPCWEWEGARRRRGYGRVWVDGQDRAAHRVAYERWHGPIPEGLLVMHLCDNPPCVNPLHLKAGTQIENLAMSAKHKASSAENGRKTALKRRVRKLDIDPELIRSLRLRYTQREVARQFGIGQGTVWRIVNYKDHYDPQRPTR